jgi:predicted nucleic acid-binding Zn ribbon protein
MFRTAARAYGPRVVGVVLSGGLDDGTYGRTLIKERRGVAVVQDPEVALIPSMPLSAIQTVEVNHILRAADMPARLVQLAGEEVAETTSMAHEEEPDVTDRMNDLEKRQDLAGPPSGLTCPECGGALRKVFHPVGVAFKGSGFYRTDSRAKPEGGSGDSGSADGTSGSKESSDKGSSDGATGGTKEGGGEAKKPASSSDKPASKPAKTSSSSGTSATTS